jgi:hypothetical protein
MRSEVEHPEEEEFGLGIEIVGRALLLAAVFLVTWPIFGADGAAQIVALAVLFGAGYHLGISREVTALTIASVALFIAGAVAVSITWGHLSFAVLYGALGIGMGVWESTKPKGSRIRGLIVAAFVGLVVAEVLDATVGTAWVTIVAATVVAVAVLLGTRSAFRPEVGP